MRINYKEKYDQLVQNSSLREGELLKQLHDYQRDADRLIVKIQTAIDVLETYKIVRESGEEK